MVMKMNKSGFIKKLIEQMDYNEEQGIIINDIFENNFRINNNNKEKIINELKEKLNIDDKEAEKVYLTSMEILTSEIKYKIKHPFTSKD